MSTYSFTVKGDEQLERLLKEEQARRVLSKQPKMSIPRLAAELIQKALSK